MSASARLNELRDLVKARNAKWRGVSVKIENEYSFYLPEVRATMIQTERQRSQTENKARIAEVQQKIVSDRARAVRAIAEKKQPNLSSSSAAERAIGEQQVNNALLFLSTSPLAERIVSEIKGALTIGRTDYASSLMDNALNDIRRDVTGKVIPTEAQKWLEVELVAIQEAMPDRAAIEQGKSELQGLEQAQAIASDFEAQEGQGVEFVLIPELFPLLTDEERQDAEQHVNGGSLVQTIALRRRIHEQMNKVRA